MLDLAGLTWFEQGRCTVTYIRFDNLPCRVMFDTDNELLALYPQLPPVEDMTIANQLLELNTKLLHHAVSVGLVNRKLIFARAKTSVEHLLPALRALLNALAAALPIFKVELAVG